MCPIIFQRDHRIFCQLVYRIFEKSNILSESQWEALNTLERLANEHAIELDVQIGDIQLVNNFAILHARRAWLDRPDHHRHYYRLGLHDHEYCWARPDQYEWLFDDHLQTPVPEQTIPVTDFDPYGLTSIPEDVHG